MSLLSQVQQATSTTGEKLYNVQLRYATVKDKIRATKYHNISNVILSEIPMIESKLFDFLQTLEDTNTLHGWTISIVPALDFESLKHKLNKMQQILEHKLENNLPL